jgi:hypothetical protein
MLSFLPVVSWLNSEKQLAIEPGACDKSVGNTRHLWVNRWRSATDFAERAGGENQEIHESRFVPFAVPILIAAMVPPSKAGL